MAKMKINRAKLNDELSQQAAWFYHAAEQSETLHKELQKLELQIELKTDTMTTSMRAKYRNVNPKVRPTETAMKAQLNIDPDMVSLKERLIEVTAAYRMSKVKVEALKMRAEMIVSMAHNVRAERKASGGPKV